VIFDLHGCIYDVVM